MSIWAAVRGAAGSYLQQDEARKAAEAEAERIRKKEEMAAALREETYAREDMKDQEEAERQRDRDNIQAETAAQARRDRLAERADLSDYRNKQLGLQGAAQKRTAEFQNDQRTAAALAATDRATAKAEKEAEKAQDAIEREVERVAADIRAMTDVADSVKWPKIKEFRDEVRNVTNPEIIRQLGARRIAELFTPEEDKTDPTGEGIMQ